MTEPRSPGRALLATAVLVLASGIGATLVRWLLDPEAPATSCITGGGTAVEAVACVALDLIASVLLWSVIVGIPAGVIVLGVVIWRRRTRR